MTGMKLSRMSITTAASKTKRKKNHLANFGRSRVGGKKRHLEVRRNMRVE
jgi:hypothetical protein